MIKGIFLKQSQKILFGFLVVLTSVFISTTAHAADSKSEITISPSSSKINLTSGQTYYGKTTIFNTGSEEFTAKVYASPYTVKDNSYTPIFDSETAKTQISRWIKFNQTQYIVKPGENTIVDWSIDVPSDSPAGGQYATIFAEVSGDSSGGFGVNVKKRIGSIIYATVAGNTRNSGSNTSFSLSKFLISTPIKTSWSVTNDGNTDFDVEYEFKVSNSSGNNILTRDRTVTVLPETTRDISIAWLKDDLANGESSPPEFGVYNIYFKYSYLDKANSETLTVVILPWWSIGLGTVFVLVLITIFVKKIKPRKISYR